MKKMKKFLSMLLAMAMVLGMSVTTFAADKKATITVNGAEEGAKFNYVQIIQPNTAKRTGWEIITPYDKCFTDAFGVDDQNVLDQMIQYNENGTASEGFVDNYAAALSSVSTLVAVGQEGNTKEVTSAGVYFIRITGEGVYSPATAYISFGTYEGGEPTNLVDASVNAKKEKDIEVTKENNDKDNVAAIGDNVQYTIKTYVPYIDPAEDKDRTYFIYDEITGAEYQNLATHTTITHAGVTTNIIPVQDRNKFYIDLSYLITPGNTNAGNEIVITYDAKITAPVINNKVAAGHENGSAAGGKFGTGSDEIFTGRITVLKYDADVNKADPSAEKVGLSNAGFEVTNEDGKTLSFTKDETTGNYVYAGIGTIQGAVLEVFTDSEGKVVLTGLDVGTYTLTEKTAPAGYSLANPETVTLEIVTKGDDETKITGVVETVDDEEVSVATKTVFNDDVEIGDTRLASLPSTGGIGTTIFTIGGCAIMIIAAGLYFSLRRRTER